MAPIGKAPSLLDEGFPLPLDLPFTSQQAAASGVTRGHLRALEREALVRRLVKGVYAAAQAPDSRLLRARALRLVVPDHAAVTDWTACWLHTGVLEFGAHRRDPTVSVFRVAGHDRLRNGLCDSGERGFAAHDLMDVDGLTVTTPLRTALDLGRLARRDAAIGGLDALLRTGAFDRDQLVDETARFKGYRGVIQLRELGPLADARAESPGESVLRLRWHDLPSLPQPEPQVPICTPDGVLVYYLDLGVEELRFGLEYDGEEHHTSDDDRAWDVLRRDDLARRWGWDVQGVRRANVFGPTRDVERLLHEGVLRARRRLGRSG